MKRPIFIYRSELLAPSETFILAQAAALKKFEPRFIGLQRAANSLMLPSTPILVSEGRHVKDQLSKKLFRLAGVAPSFYKKAASVKAVMIHAHFGPDGVAALPLADKLRVPLVVTLHGFDVTLTEQEHAKSFLGRMYLMRRKKLWERAALFVCVSDFIRRKAVEAGFPEEKIATHYIGVDRSLFAATSSNYESQEVVFVGRFVEKKGGEFLIRAMALLKERCPQTKLVFIGDGPLRDQWQRVSHECRVSCEFSGFMTAEAIRARLASAAVFCVPSTRASNGDSEGLGMVFLEAQAMGVPVVSFRHGGIPEAVDDGHTGLLAGERNIEDLAAKLLVYLEDRDLRRTSGENGKEWVKQRFDLAAQTVSLESHYEKVLTDWSNKKFSATLQS